MACNCIGGNPCPCQRGVWPGARIEFGPPIPATHDFSKLLDAARLHTMTPKEVYEQRVSWIMGMVPFRREITREEVVRHLEEMGVVDPESRDEGNGSIR